MITRTAGLLFFSSPKDEKNKNLEQEQLELDNLKKTTANELDKYNDEVRYLWKREYDLEQTKLRLKKERENQELLKKVADLETEIKIYTKNLLESQLNKVLHNKLQQIEHLENKLHPEKRFHLSSPFNLRK